MLGFAQALGFGGLDPVLREVWMQEASATAAIEVQKIDGGRHATYPVLGNARAQQLERASTQIAGLSRR